MYCQIWKHSSQSKSQKLRRSGIQCEPSHCNQVLETMQFFCGGSTSTGIWPSAIDFCFAKRFILRPSCFKLFLVWCQLNKKNALQKVKNVWTESFLLLFQIIWNLTFYFYVKLQSKQSENKILCFFNQQPLKTCTTWEQIVIQNLQPRNWRNAGGCASSVYVVDFALVLARLITSIPQRSRLLPASP